MFRVDAFHKCPVQQNLFVFKDRGGDVNDNEACKFLKICQLFVKDQSGIIGGNADRIEGAFCFAQWSEFREVVEDGFSGLRSRVLFPMVIGVDETLQILVDRSQTSEPPEKSWDETLVGE